MSFCYTFILILLLIVTGICQDSTAYKIFINNVYVPQNKIKLDSISKEGRYYYSGLLKYDVESILDSFFIHIYLEEVPFNRYLITRHSSSNVNDKDTFTGNAPFIKIDSLCKGDLGFIKPGKERIVYWQYSTNNIENHCRIKVGVGNYLYSCISIDNFDNSGICKGFSRYEYNNLGLISLREDSNEYFPSKRKIIPKYTKCGQLIVDDINEPFIFNYYDDKCRAVYKRKADSEGFLIHYILGYVYDSLSRAVQIQHLDFGATPHNFGTPFNIEYITYDNFGRVAKIESNFRTFVQSCNPVYDFKGKQICLFYYNSIITNQRDSFVREFYEYNKEPNKYKLVSKIVNKNYYESNGMLKEVFTIVMGLDDYGKCWGSQFYEERLSRYYYDNFGYVIRVENFLKKPPDTNFYLNGTSLCYRHEYDVSGNIIKKFEFCDNYERIVYEASFNSYNHIVHKKGYIYSKDTSVVITKYNWQLIDLDKQKEYLYE